MGIKVVWDDDTHSCIRYDVQGAWSIEDLVAARHEAELMTDGVSGKVAVIVDLRASQFVPNGMMAHFGTRSYNTLDQLGLMVFVGANSLVRGLFASFQRIYRKRAMVWQFADSVDDARRIVNDYKMDRLILEPITRAF